MKAQRGAFTSRCHTATAQGSPAPDSLLGTLAPLFFLLYYYAPFINQVARKAPGASFGQGQTSL